MIEICKDKIIILCQLQVSDSIARKSEKRQIPTSFQALLQIAALELGQHVYDSAINVGNDIHPNIFIFG